MSLVLNLKKLRSLSPYIGMMITSAFPKTALAIGHTEKSFYDLQAKAKESATAAENQADNLE